MKRNSMGQHTSVGERSHQGMNGCIPHERRYRVIHVRTELSLLK